MHTKQNFEIDFSFSSFYSPFFFVLIPFFLSLVAGLCLDFIYEFKSFLENTDEGELFFKAVVQRPELIPSILPVKSDRFLSCYSGLINEISLIRTSLKDFFLLHGFKVMKDIFCHKREEVTTGKRTVVLSSFFSQSIEKWKRKLSIKKDGVTDHPSELNLCKVSNAKAFSPLCA